MRVTLRILLTGATGFVGRHLAARLKQTQHELLMASRHPERAATADSARWVRCDLDDPSTLPAALEGIDVVYYLVHGMGASGGDYVARERRWANDFVTAAHEAGVRRIVYLGGVQPSGHASAHLESRLATGRILREGAVPTVELRAGMIVGPGSESWRIVRDLSVRLPAMILPAWLQNRMQPVGIRDVITALVRAADADVPPGVYGVPGDEVMTGEQVLRRVSGIGGTRPFCISVPFVTPRLSSYWIRLVTRADPHIATELVEGMAHDLISQEDPFWTYLPDHTLETFDEAAEIALDAEAASLSFGTRVTERILHRLAPHRT